MKLIHVISLLGCVLFAVQYTRNAQDQIEFPIKYANFTISLLPATLGFEYFPEVHSSKTFSIDFSSSKYGGLPYILAWSDDTPPYADRFPRRLQGHPFFSYINRGAPHIAIAIAIPYWVFLLPLVSLSLISVYKNNISTKQPSST